MVFATDKSPNLPGSFKVGFRQTVITDFSRTAGADFAGRKLEVVVWYPIDEAVAAGGIPVVYDNSTSSAAIYGVPPVYIARRPTLDVRVAPTSVLPLSLSGPNIPACDVPFGSACSASSIVGLPISNLGPFPLLALSHGGGLTPKDYATYSEHLASHGYIVVAPLHAGLSTPDALVTLATGGLTCGALPIRPCQDSGSMPALNSPRDISFAIDKVLDGSLGADLIAATDNQKIGVLGHSYGGYTALMLAGGLKSATGSFGVGDLADPRIRAVVAMSASVAIPGLILPNPDIEAIHIPTIVMVGQYEENWDGVNYVAAAQNFFARLNPEKTGMQYYVSVHKAAHPSFPGNCEQGYIDTIKLGNGNPTGIDAAIARVFFLSNRNIPPYPASLIGKTHSGYQAYCRNSFFYEPTNLAFWTALGLDGLLLNRPPFSIPLEQLPGFIDPLTFQFVQTRSSDEIQNLTNGYLVSFFNTYLNGESQYDRFLVGGDDAEVVQCRQADGQRKCKSR